MKLERELEICKDLDEGIAYTIKVPYNHKKKIIVCVSERVAGWVDETQQYDTALKPAKLPIDIVNEQCDTGQTVKKQLLHRFQLSIDRYGNHHFDLVYFDGQYYKIPLPH